MTQENIVTTSNLSLFLEAYIGLKFIETGVRNDSTQEREVLEDIVNDPQRINSLLCLLNEGGANLVNLDCNPELDLVSIGTDMDFSTARRIAK